MFSITQRKGFQITFSNGYTVSVQFGYGNYCDNRNDGFFGEDAKDCPNAEVAVWNRDGKWERLSEYDDVIGNQTPDEVAAIIAKYSAM